MSISIKPNDYKPVSECRENIVQMICDAFLHGTFSSAFHPNCGGRYRNLTDYVICNRNGQAYGFNDQPDTFTGEHGYKIRRCEVEKAIELLLENGYYLYRKLMYGSWVSYVIENRPNLHDMSRMGRIQESDWDGYFD